MRTFLISLSLLISLLSCSTIPQLDQKWIVKTADITEVEARKILERKRKFLELTFSQEKDLNYNTDKWNAGCLARNQVGKIQENGNAILFISDLVTDADYHIGLCPGQSDTRDVRFVTLYCRNKKALYELRCSVDECRNYPWAKIC